MIIQVLQIDPVNVSPTSDGFPIRKPVFLIMDSYDDTGNNIGDDRAFVSLYGTGVMRGSFWYSAYTATSSGGSAGSWFVGTITLTPSLETASYAVDISMGEFSIIGVIPFAGTFSSTPPQPLQTWSVDYGFFRDYSAAYIESMGEYYTFSISLQNIDTTDGVNGAASGELTAGDGSDVDFDLGEPASPTDYQYSTSDAKFEYEWEITQLTGLTEGNYTANYEHKTTVELNLDAYEGSPVHNAMDVYFTGFCGLVAFALPYRTLLKKH